MRLHYIPDEVPVELWDVLERAQGNEDRLIAELEEMDRDGVARFCWNYAEAAAYLREPPYLDYADPCLSDDGVHDLAHWIVAQGRDTYRGVYDHPERMAQGIKPDPGLRGAALDYYEKRFGEEVPWHGGGFVHPPAPELPKKDT